MQYKFMAIFTWCASFWGALNGLPDDTVVSPQMRLDRLCHIQSALWVISAPHTAAILYSLSNDFGSTQRVNSPISYSEPVWPMLPHELLGVDIYTIAKLTPDARRFELFSAWSRRSRAIIESRGIEVPSDLLGRKLTKADFFRLTAELVRLGSVAAEELSTDESWKLYLDKMVAKKSWLPRWFAKDEDNDMRRERLEAVCRA